MINWIAVLLRQEPAFLGWLKGIGLTDETIRNRIKIAEATGSLVPACFVPEELAEVLQDFYEEIFRQELRSWQTDEAYWPDTAHFGLFARRFRVESCLEVCDAGRGAITEEL